MIRRKRFGRKKKKLSGAKWILCIVFTCFVLLITYMLYLVDTRVMPPVMASYHAQATTNINEAISRSVTRIIEEKNLDASDFYTKNTDENGRINSFSVNTLLVNEICNRTAVEISRDLEEGGHRKIVMPIGAIMGISLLANMGPNYAVTILPVGNAVVDYNTKFESAGINQINFQVWLNIQSSVKVIIPFQNSQITVTKDVPLVNTVFSGEVPNAYFNMDQR